MGTKEQSNNRKTARRRSEKTDSSAEIEVIKRLPTLPPEAIARVKKHVDALIDQKPTNQTSNSEVHLVYDAMVGAIRIGGTLAPPPDLYQFKIKHKRHFKSLEDNAELLEQYARTEFQANARVDRQRVYTLCFRLLKDRLKENSESIGVVSMLNNMGSIPSIIDDAFPGYDEAELLPFVLRQINV